MTIAQWEETFPDDDACKRYLAANRWSEGVSCPRCGNTNCYRLDKDWHWQCAACSKSGYRFSVMVGTVFENTKLPLRTWFRVIHMMLTSKKGVSALQVHQRPLAPRRSYQSAWYMCHRIRAGLIEPEFRKLVGIVEVDETFVGGKDKNRHWDKKSGGVGGQNTNKFIVIGAVERKGSVVARVIENTTTETFEGFVRQAVSDKVSLLTTDEHSGYRRLSADYPHKFIRHRANQYVVGSIHTNTIEGFWSILKRGVVGTFNKVTEKYLPLSVAEFEFRYNNRGSSDIFRTAIKGLSMRTALIVAFLVLDAGDTPGPF